jgi:hypothetical protein
VADMDQFIDRLVIDLNFRARSDCKILIKLMWAWCGRELGIVDANPPDLDEISQGICLACDKTQMNKVDNIRTMRP